jgi:hypothetical protein
MVKNDPSDNLNQVALPVDVFHFKAKHKTSDKFCTENCNPILFPELVGENNQWIFNSSAAEQANSWIGKFQSIVREMRVDQYNFFLDEMVRRRNDWTIGELEKKGKSPWNLSYSTLLPSIFGEPISA